LQLTVVNILEHALQHVNWLKQVKINQKVLIHLRAVSEMPLFTPMTTHLLIQLTTLSAPPNSKFT